jgi:isopentenyl-diphosphate delta-isomerase
MELVILVDEADEPLGSQDKLAAHQPPGQLHRAVSVFVFDPSGRLLLQQRAAAKHHFRRRWSNTCCTPPRPGETVLDAGRRRLQEEMGISAELTAAGAFTYRATDPESGLVEHELDHVLVGRSAGEPVPDAAEVRAWEWIEVASLRRHLAAEPGRYTPWLGPALELAVP